LLHGRIWGPDGDRAVWLIPTFGVLLIALMWIGVLERGTSDRAMVIDAAKKSIDGVAATFEQRTLRTIKNADVTALLLKYQFEESGQVDIDRAMARGIIPANAYVLVSIADAQGTVVASSEPLMIGLYVGDRADFRHHADIDTGILDIGKPLPLETSGRPVIPLSRRLNDAAGQFTGIVFLAVDPDFFTDFYTEAGLGSQGTLGLLGFDGVYRVRRTSSVAQARVTPGRSPVLEHAKAASSGTFVAISPIDGLHRMVAYRKVPDLPLYAVVTRSEDEVLLELRQRQRIYHWGAGIATATLLLFFGILFALAWSLKQSRRRAWMRAHDLLLASKVYETTADGIMVTDADDRIMMVNAAFSKLTGFSADEVLGSVLADSPFKPVDPEAAAKRVAEMLRNGHVTGEVQRLRKDGTPLALWITATALKDDAGRMENCVRVFTDISALKASQRQLEAMAMVDSLTGLPNRRAFNDRLAQAVAGAQRHRGEFALLFIDLDHFKPVNDQFGHETGDQLLTKVASMLRAIVRGTDTAFRIGGDEFTVIFEMGTGAATAQMVAERIIVALKSLVIVNGHAVVTGASVGIALYPEHGQTVDELVQRADTAMYAAKSSGRNQLAMSGGQPIAPLWGKISTGIDEINDTKTARTHVAAVGLLNSTVSPEFGNRVQPHDDEARVNIANRSAVDCLSTAFRCRPEDVYAAISTVGDRARDVHRFLEVLAREKGRPLAPFP
jgi:diguanylate cyclase (GGDEF)-like protein/PAS domain S-box-containing protein